MHDLEQIINLEYFLHQDAEKSPEDLHKRDRQLALQLESDPSFTPSSVTRLELLAGWLQLREEKNFSSHLSKSPGEIFSDSRTLATTLIVIKGLVAGLFAGWAFFAYAGTTPINVLQFLLFFVATQLVIALFLLATICCRKFLPGSRLPTGQFYLLRRLGTWLFSWINKQWYEKIGAGNRASVHHAFGIIKSKTKTYGTLFYWPFFTLAQLFGITFNIGLLSASLVKILTSDLAFGWQSTIQFGSEAIHKLVTWLALPWGWLLPPGVGTPTLSEIEGSHIILKDGIYNLVTENLVAWWPFLLCCVLFYGLLVRLVLFITGRIMEKRSLENIRFTHPPCSALIRRMTTPIVSTQAIKESPKPTTEKPPQPPPEITVEVEEAEASGFLFIPDEIYDKCAETELSNMLSVHGYQEKERYRFMVGYDEDQQLLEKMKKHSWQESDAVFIIMEAWMVPLVDFLEFLKELRSITLPQTPIELALTGEEGGSLFTDVKQSDLTIWRRKIEAIGDPYLHITPIKGVAHTEL